MNTISKVNNGPIQIYSYVKIGRNKLQTDPKNAESTVEKITTFNTFRWVEVDVEYLRYKM